MVASCNYTPEPRARGRPRRSSAKTSMRAAIASGSSIRPKCVAPGSSSNSAPGIARAMRSDRCGGVRRSRPPAISSAGVRISCQHVPGVVRVERLEVTRVEREVERRPRLGDLGEGRDVEARRHQTESARGADEGARDARRPRQPRSHAAETRAGGAQRGEHAGCDQRGPRRIEGGGEGPSRGAEQADHAARELRVLAVQLQRELHAHAPAHQQRRLAPARVAAAQPGRRPGGASSARRSSAAPRSRRARDSPTSTRGSVGRGAPAAAATPRSRRRAPRTAPAARRAGRPSRTRRAACRRRRETCRSGSP